MRAASKLLDCCLVDVGLTGITPMEDVVVIELGERLVDVDVLDEVFDAELTCLIVADVEGVVTEVWFAATVQND